MRRVIIGLGMLGLAQSALAADLPYLKGSVMPTYHWAGFYAGAQVGYASASFDFSNGVSSLLAFVLRGYPTLAGDVSGWNVFGQGSTNGVTYGAFLGYNVDWEGVILGLELNYSRSALSKSVADTASGADPNPSIISPIEYYSFYSVTVTGSTAVKITDVATLRGRAGWEVGPFLPYAFGAVAMGRANVTQSVGATALYTDWTDTNCVAGVCTYQQVGAGRLAFPTLTSSQTGEFIFGGAAGIGLDTLLTSNVLWRLEWEYLLFQPVQGVHVNISTIRTALGVMF